MSIVFDTPTTGAISSAASCTVSHTVASGQSALWVVAVCWNSSDLLSTGSCSWAGSSMGSPKYTLTVGGACYLYVWEKLAPSAATANAVVTPSSAAYLDVWVICASGTDATAPLDTANASKTETNFATSPNTNSVTIPSGGACLAFAAVRITTASTLTQSASGMTAVGAAPTGYAHTQMATGQSVTASTWGWTNGSAGADKIATFAMPIKAAAAPAGPTITGQPGNATVTTPTAANFSVTASASGGGTLSYQWQRSTNSGSTWANVTTGSGGTTNAYTTGATAVTGGTDNNGDQYRCVVTETGGTNAGSTNSSAATLTVNAGGGSSAPLLLLMQSIH